MMVIIYPLGMQMLQNFCCIQQASGLESTRKIVHIQVIFARFGNDVAVQRTRRTYIWSSMNQGNNDLPID